MPGSRSLPSGAMRSMCFGERAFADSWGIPRVLRVNRDIEALTEHLDLIDGGRAVDVGGNQQRPLTFLFEVTR